MNTICSQCGSVIPELSGYCPYCDTASEEANACVPSARSSAASSQPLWGAPDASVDPAWRSELASRLAAYRTRRRKRAAHDTQPDLPFESVAPALALDEPAPLEVSAGSSAEPENEGFAFTIAIGRSAKPALDSSLQPGEAEPAHMEIDVSAPASSLPELEPPEEPIHPRQTLLESQLYPVASLAERVLAALFDGGCLLLAYAGFFLFFTAFGGQFPASKLTAAVGLLTFGIFYFQYFALFTVLAGATPGLMLRGLRVVSFSGEPPSLRQLLLRSLGYLFSAGSFLLGFLWAYWDEDSLTWHDRLSHTYLTSAAPILKAEVQDTVEGI